MHILTRGHAYLCQRSRLLGTYGSSSLHGITLLIEKLVSGGNVVILDGMFV